MHRALQGRPVYAPASERGSRSTTRTRPLPMGAARYQSEELAPLFHFPISLFQPGQRTVIEVALSDESPRPQGETAIPVDQCSVEIDQRRHIGHPGRLVQLSPFVTLRRR